MKAEIIKFWVILSSVFDGSMGDIVQNIGNQETIEDFSAVPPHCSCSWVVHLQRAHSSSMVMVEKTDTGRIESFKMACNNVYAGSNQELII